MKGGGFRCANAASTLNTHSKAYLPLRTFFLLARLLSPPSEGSRFAPKSCIVRRYARRLCERSSGKLAEKMTGRGIRPETPGHVFGTRWVTRDHSSPRRRCYTMSDPKASHTSGDAELDALVRDLSAKVRTSGLPDAYVPTGSVQGDFDGDVHPFRGEKDADEGDASTSTEAQADALLAALGDSDAVPGSSGARLIDIDDIDSFTSDAMKKEADDIIALMMKYETGRGSLSDDKKEQTSDEVADVLVNAAKEFNTTRQGADQGDAELKELMKKLAVDLKDEKSKK